MTDDKLRLKVIEMINILLSHNSGQVFKELFSGSKVEGHVTEGFSPYGRKANVMVITLGWETTQPSTYSASETL